MKKKFGIIMSSSIRKVLEEANKLGLTKEDYVETLIKSDGVYLIYYK